MINTVNVFIKIQKHYWWEFNSFTFIISLYSVTFEKHAD